MSVHQGAEGEEGEAVEEGEASIMEAATAKEVKKHTGFTGTKWVDYVSVIMLNLYIKLVYSS